MSLNKIVAKPEFLEIKEVDQLSHGAAGSLRQLDPRITAERPLDVVVYEVMAAEGVRFSTDSQALKSLEEWGLPTPRRIFTLSTVSEIVQRHAELAEARDRLPYEIDGVVVKPDDLGARDKLGSTAHLPRWAIAYKFVPRGEETRIEQIAIQVGRTGVLTPVALMRPVEVGGVTISRATLHNREELQRKNIRRGDLVRIQRAGDVIPEVAERIAEPRRGRKPPFKMPAKCPACGSPVVERVPYTLCPNHFGCPAQLKGRIRHLASREGLDIEGLGDETVSALIDHGLVRDVAGIFRLKKEDLFGSKDLPSARPRNSSTRSTIAGASGLANSSTLWEFQRSVPPWREISRKSSAALKV